MKTEMGMVELEDRLTGDLLDIIRFTEEVSAKLHRVLDEAEIYRVVREEFVKSDRYTANILLLAAGGKSLKLVETSVSPSRLEVLERASGLQAKEYKIRLSRSSIFSEVVKEGRTVHANVGDIIREFLPQPLAFLITNTMGYDEKSTILTPLRKHGKVVGILAMSCTDLCEYLLPSVENLALHITTALELAQEHAQRKRAVQTLKSYHDRLGERVEERTAELKEVNKKLLKEINERKQTEEALRKIEQEKSAILNSMSEHMVYQDAEHRILWTNKAAAESVGMSIEQLVGRRCYEVWPQRNKPCVGCPVAKARESGKPQQAEITTPDGRVWFIRGYPLRDADKHLVGAVEVTLEITEYKQAEQALQAEKNKLQSVVDAMEYGLTIQDRDYNIIYQSTLQRKIWGDRLGEKCYRVYEGKEKICEGCPIKKAFRDGKSHTVERETVMPSGEVVFWENTANPIRDARGKVVSCLEVTRNITERKQAEDALRESEEFSSSLLAKAPNPVLVINQDTSVRYVNPAFEKLSGFSSKEVIGRKAPYLWWTEETLKKTSGDLKEAMSRGAVRIEELFKKKNGERFWVEITSAPLRKDGEYKYYLANWVDITEHKQAEDALRESEEKLQKMFESVTDGISVVDLNGAIIETNQRMVEMHGFASRDELLGRKASELVAPRDRERIARNMRKAIKEGAVIGVEYTLLRADGSEFAGELSTNVIKDASGRVVAHITVSRDITERKQMGEALRESEERFRSIVENSQAGILIVDDAYRFTYVNDELCRILGYSREEAIGQDFRQFLDEESRKLVAERYIRRQRGEEVPSRYEFNVVHKSGQKRRVEISSAVIKDSVGRVKTVAQILDITERKKAEESLRESEEKYKTLAEDVPAAIYFNDFKGTFLYGNKKAEEITGYKREELLGKSFLKLRLLDPKEMSKAAKFLALNRLGKATGPDRLVLNRKDGTKRIVEIRTRITTVGGKKVVLGMVEDITERKQWEQALADEVTRRRILIDQSLDGIVVLGEDARVYEANRRFAEMLGYTPEEVLKLHTWDWDKNFPPEQLLEMGRAVDEKGLHLETRHHRKDGSVIDVDISINGVVVAGQKLVFCVCRDVTERKRAEEALRESQEFSSSLLESSPNPINVVNMDTSIRYVNPAFEKLTGFTFDEIRGRKAPHPWWPEGKRARILAAFKDSVEHGGRRSGTAHNFQKKNGERFWVEINSAPVIREGKPVYLIISWLDVTQRKRAEEKEKQLQQDLYLAQRLASVGELAAGVAHEINNPLTGVLGFSQRLMRKSTDEAFSRDLKIIHGEARRAAEVVQNLLTFARRRQPKKEYASINDIVQKTLELRDYALQTSNIEVVTTFAPNLPQIMVDFPQMQEVFLNIILNAEQAMNEAHGRGKLIVKTREIKDHVRVSFADDGPGIAPENLDKVFDPFFTTRGERGGTGLGLSACHGIVTEHGGRIYVRSKPGKGTTFFIELPLSPVGR
jgi:PAS domain S-box-containing protein